MGLSAVLGFCLFGRNHHNHKAAFEAGSLFDLGNFLDDAMGALEQIKTNVLVRDLATAETQRHLDFVSLVEKALNLSHLDLEVMIPDVGAEFDFLDFYDFLLLFGLVGAFLQFVFVASCVEDFANGGLGIGGDLDKVKPCFVGEAQPFGDANNANHFSVFINQANGAGANVPIGPRAVFSWWSLTRCCTFGRNGTLSFCDLYVETGGRLAKAKPPLKKNKQKLIFR